MATKTSRGPKAPGYKCAECGWTTAKWVGRCGECQAWGSVEETGTAVARTTAATTVLEPARRIADVDATTAAFLPTGVDELDRVLGGGLVPGAVILLAGEPGVGKSTLLLDVAAKFARTAQDVLYITGEESAAQVKLRADRIDAVAESCIRQPKRTWGRPWGKWKLEPRLLVVDSVQTLSSADVEGSAGGVSQVREVAASLIAAAKRRNMTTLLVGHVTKDGSIAGPRLLEHLVDVVCQFEGERHSRLRLLRAVKNRYGPTDDVGCFDLNEDGIEGLADPSGLFVSRTKEPVSGTCITVTLRGPPAAAGRGPGAACRECQLPAPPRHQRTGQLAGGDAAGRAAAARRLPAAQGRLRCGNGRRGQAQRTATDLAVALAVASAKARKPLPQRLIAFGEVGLAGEVRPVPGINQRIQEAHRLGFTHAVVPASPQRARPGSRWLLGSRGGQPGRGAGTSDQLTRQRTTLLQEYLGVS